MCGSILEPKGPLQLRGSTNNAAKGVSLFDIMRIFLPHHFAFRQLQTELGCCVVRKYRKEYEHNANLAAIKYATEIQYAAHLVSIISVFQRL